MRVAALYDIHANLPALEAVVREVHGAKVERVVVGIDYPLGEAAERLADTAYPEAATFVARHVLHPPSEEEMLQVFDSTRS